MSVIVDFYVSDKERAITLKELAQYFNKTIAKVIEGGIYDYTEQYCRNNSHNKLLAHTIYKDNRKNLMFNCEQNNSTIKQLKLDIAKNKYNPYNLAFLRPEELDEDRWVKIIMRRNTTEEKLNNLPTVTWKPCIRCKGTEYSKFQLQTRSIDEPMTTYYDCKNCGKRYSQNV